MGMVEQKNSMIDGVNSRVDTKQFIHTDDTKT